MTDRQGYRIDKDFVNRFAVEGVMLIVGVTSLILDVVLWVIAVPSKPMKPCRYPGCKQVTASLYCETHVLNKKDTKRGTAAKGVMVHVGRSTEGCI